MKWLLALAIVVIKILRTNVSSATHTNSQLGYSKYYVVMLKDRYDDNSLNLFDLRKAIDKETDDAVSIESKREIPPKNVTDGKPKARKVNSDDKRSILVRKQHKERLDYIRNFLADHHLSAKYLKQEVDRIRKTNIIKDDLRKMAQILDKPEFVKVRTRFTSCYDSLVSKLDKPPIDIWNQKTNNLVMHLVSDYFNDGL